MNVLCAAPEPCCCYGRVYATTWGLLFRGMQTIRVAVAIPGHSQERIARASVLLTFPGGRPRDVEFLPLSCRHGQPACAEPRRHVDAVRRLAASRAAAVPTRPPHKYVVRG